MKRDIVREPETEPVITCGKDVKISFCLAAPQDPAGGGEKPT